MATHLIFDNQGTPHLATETENGFLTNSGIFANSNIRFACPVGELEKQVIMFGAWDYILQCPGSLAIIEEHGFAEMQRRFKLPKDHDNYLCNDDTQIGWEECFKFMQASIVHLSEARRLGLIPRTDDTEATN